MNSLEEAKKIPRKRLATAVAVAWGLFQIYAAAFGMFEAYQLRVIHLLFALILIFLVHPSGKEGKLGPADPVLILLALAGLGYLLVNYTEITTGRFQFVTPLTLSQKVFGIITVLVVLEATRRAVGLALSLIAALFYLYAFLGQYLPGAILRHAGYNLGLILDVQYTSTEGMFGIPLGASATFVVLFIIFAAFLERSGLGSLLMDFATGIAGRFSGGPAKVAVVSSGLMGMISGSAVANVVTTGMVTIPLMKRVGYRPHFAGAVEAVASTGGQIMPPVMGTIAFIMVQYTGLPYIKIAAYAVAPAVLYFLGVGMMVHWEAKKSGLRGLSKEELPDWVATFKRKWHLTLPIFLLIWLMARGFTPQFAVVWSLLFLLLVANFRKDTRMGVKAIVEALESGARGTLLVAASTATAGMIAGIFGITGLGLRFTSYLVDISGGSLLLALLLVMVASVILGLGVPPSGSYIIQVAITIPATVKLLTANNAIDPAVALLVSHFFVMYYSSLGTITPPDALASYSAAGVAQANAWQTSMTACWLAFAGYIVPFVFVYQPALLLQGTIPEVIQALASGVLGVFALSMALQGYFLQPLRWWERGLALLGGLGLVERHIVTDAAGILLLVVLLVSQLTLRARNSRAKAEVA